jgi:hypothetical protein
MFVGCDRKGSNYSSCQSAAEPPPPIFFRINKNGQLITDSTFLSAIKLSYYQNNNKYYVTDFGLLSGTDSIHNITYNNKGVMYAGIKSVNNNTNTYYLEYPNNFSSQDTLFAYYLNPSPTTNCEYKINEVTINSQKPTSDSTDFPFVVYILNK